MHKSYTVLVRFDTGWEKGHEIARSQVLFLNYRQLADIHKISDRIISIEVIATASATNNDNYSKITPHQEGDVGF